MIDAVEKSEIILKGVANLAMGMTNVRGVPSIAKVAVGAMGNWVGGRFTLTASHLTFQINGLNQRFQRDNSDTILALPDVTGVHTGKLFWFFKTVDVTTTQGLFRFRCSPGTTIKLLANLRQLCPEAAH